ncbi:MAG: XdhC family protein [Caldilineaceae bacterium]|nr:XdhC family protein [Caldilineaceae bacterium]
MSALYTTFTEAIRQGRLVGLATIIAGPGIGRKLLLWPNGETQGNLGTAELNQAVAERGKGALAAQQTERFVLTTAADEVEIFLEVHAALPKLILIGAVHIAIALVTFGKTLGFRTIVLDARSAFATPERFSHVDELRIGWPADLLPEIGLDESTYVVALTHDEKIDNPALAVALQSPARYVGALGSRKTHAKRVAALQELGVSDEQIAQIHAPIGLSIGARRPEEIAVSIMAEIVAVMNNHQSPSQSPGR